MHCRPHSFVAITLAVCLGVGLSSLGAQNSEPRPVRRPPAAAAERTMTVKGRHVTLEFRQSDFNLLKNPKDLTDFLDSVYEKMQELTFHSPTMSLRGQRNLDAWGTADEDGIEIDWTCVPPLMNGFNTGTIEFGVIHEMGHVFDARNFGRWYITPICGGETFANIKLSYAVDSLLRRDNQYRIEFGPGGRQTGYDFNNNFYLNAGKKYLASDTTWDKMDVDDLHSFHMTLIRRYGWDVYKKWFRAYYLIEAQKDGRAPSSCNDPVRINMVCALLSSFSGGNLVPDFQEWRMPVTDKSVSEVVKRYQLTDVCAAVEKQFAREYAEGRISLDPLSLRVTVETVPNKPEAKVGFFSALKADGAIIRYTLDKSAVGSASTKPYLGAPITVTQPVTVNAAMYLPGKKEPILKTSLMVNPAQAKRADGSGILPKFAFDDQSTVAFQSAVPGATIRYTTDGKDPSVDSTLCSAPIHLHDGKSSKAVVKACALGKDGKPLGAVWNREYYFKPLAGSVSGTITPGDRISEPGTVTLTSAK